MVSYIRKFFIFIFLFCFFALSSTFYANSVLVDKILARVNGSVITQSDFEDIKNFMKRQYGDVKDQLIFEHLIDTEIIFQITSEENIEPDYVDIEKEIAMMKKKSGVVTEEAFLAILEKQGFPSLEILRYELKKKSAYTNLVGHLIRNHFIDHPSDEEIQKEFKKNEEKFQDKEKVKISHILIKISDKEPYAQLKSKEKLAGTILSQIKSGKQEFEDLALKYSDDRTNNKMGGLLGWFDRDKLQGFSPEYADKAFSLKNDEVSDIIFTNIGFHIIKRLDHQEARKVPYEEAKPYVNEQMLRSRADKHVKRMIEMKKKRSFIEVFDDTMKSES